MEGLQAGRIVNYVMKNGSIRPLVIVRVWGDEPLPGYCNGVLVFDGANDKGDFPDGISDPAVMSGVQTSGTAWVTSTHYDEQDMKPGTWHWPTVKKPAAPPLTVDAVKEIIKNELSSVPPAITIDEVTARVQNLLDDHMASIKKLLDDHTTSMVAAMVSSAPPAVLGAAAGASVGLVPQAATSNAPAPGSLAFVTEIPAPVTVAPSGEAPAPANGNGAATAPASSGDEISQAATAGGTNAAPATSGEQNASQQSATAANAGTGSGQ